MHFVTPIDYWRSSVALWKQGAEFQIEMTRMAYGLAGSWQGAVFTSKAALAVHSERATPPVPTRVAPVQKKPAPELVAREPAGKETASRPALASVGSSAPVAAPKPVAAAKPVEKASVATVVTLPATGKSQGSVGAPPKSRVDATPVNLVAPVAGDTPVATTNGTNEIEAKGSAEKLTQAKALQPAALEAKPAAMPAAQPDDLEATQSLIESLALEQRKTAASAVEPQAPRKPKSKVANTRKSSRRKPGLGTKT
ncbi:MAG: Meckel syndrome type 1 protein [Paracoccaceae bacterium]|jgi:Meckel syndrome type 1 protein